MARPLTPAERSELGPQCYALSLEGHSNRSIAAQLGIHRQTVSRLIGSEAKSRRQELLRENVEVHLLDRVRRAQSETWERLSCLPKASASPAASGLMHALNNLLKTEMDLLGIRPPDKRTVRHEHVRRSAQDFDRLTYEELNQLEDLWAKTLPDYSEGGQLDDEDENGVIVQELAPGEED